MINIYRVKIKQNTYIMKITCIHCQKKFLVDENKYTQGNAERLECPHCGQSAYYIITPNDDEDDDESIDDSKVDNDDAKDNNYTNNNDDTKVKDDTEDKNDTEDNDDTTKNDNTKSPINKKVLFIISAIVLCAVCIIIWITTHKYEKAYSIAEKVNIRQDTTITSTSNVIDSIFYGDSLEILRRYKNNSKWAKVKFTNKQGKRVKGYASLDFFVSKNAIDSLNLIWGNDSARFKITESYHRKALLNYINDKQKEMVICQNIWKFNNNWKYNYRTNVKNFRFEKNKDNYYVDLYAIIENDIIEKSSSAKLIAYSFDSLGSPIFKWETNIPFEMAEEGIKSPNKKYLYMAAMKIWISDYKNAEEYYNVYKLLSNEDDQKIKFILDYHKNQIPNENYYYIRFEPRLWEDLKKDNKYKDCKEVKRLLNNHSDEEKLQLLKTYIYQNYKIHKDANYWYNNIKVLHFYDGWDLMFE